MINLLRESFEEDLEDISITVELNGGGKFDYAIVDELMSPTNEGKLAYISSVSAPKDAEMNPIKGTKTLQRMAKYIKQKHPQVEYMIGKPISDSAAKAFTNSFNLTTDAKKDSMFRINLNESRMKKIASTLAIAAASVLPLKGAIDHTALFKQIADHEGIEKRAYRDGDGYSIGIGFNLTDKDNLRFLQMKGVDIRGLLKGEKELTDKSITNLYKFSLNKAYNDAKSIFKNFDSLPEEAQMVLLDMSFNLGGPRLKKFEKMIAAVNKKDFQKAADEMKNSKWYDQVKRRGVKLVKMMRSIK